MNDFFKIRCNNKNEFDIIQNVLNSEGHIWNSGSNFIEYLNNFPIIIISNYKILTYSSYPSMEDLKYKDFIKYIRKYKLKKFDIK